HLPPLPTGPMNLTIVAEGWMPQLRAIDVKSDMSPVDFQLKPGKTLRVRVVDIDGRPVPKVLLDIERWRDLESLYNRKHPNVLDSKIPRNADENGIYEWGWAPDDAVTFRLSAIGDFATPEVTLTASDHEQVFTLPPVLRISGGVTDAKTGRPIDKFT